MQRIALVLPDRVKSDEINQLDIRYDYCILKSFSPLKHSGDYICL
jgi:hypothetical protein